MASMAAAVLARPGAAAPPACNSSPAIARPRMLPPQPRRVLAAHAFGSLESALASAEARLDAWVAAGVGASGSPLVRPLQAALAAAAVALQQLLRWAHLALLALHLQRGRAAPQLAYAGAAAGGGAGDNSSAAPPAAACAAADPQQQQQQQQQPGVPVMGFISAATTGAVEHLRHTLMDANSELEPKMRALQRTASSVQEELFQAARAHSEAVRSNPQVGMWKQPSVGAVISEEEKLRAAVFAQVYAELSQKGNAEISYHSAPQQP